MKARRRIYDASRPSSLTSAEESQQRQVYKRRRQPWNGNQLGDERGEWEKGMKYINIIWGGCLKCEEEKGKRERDA